MILEGFFRLVRGAGVPRGMTGESGKKMFYILKYVFKL